MSHSRTSLFVFLSSLACASLGSAGSTVHGTIVDPSGRPVPRAHVRVLDPSGRERASAFADENGRFDVASMEDCRIEASLAGFDTTTAPCSDSDMRVQMPLAPISEHIIVSATSTPAPTSQIGASASVFTADDLAVRREPLVADLLRATPGAMVIRTGAPGGVTSLFVRGGESNYNKVLVDGIPINEPGGVFNFSNLTTDNLDRIEVLRGAHSALFGSDAMASVVQLFTKRANRLDPQPHGTASVEGGTFSTYDATATVSGAHGALDYSLGVNRDATDNQGVNDGFRNTALTLNAGTDLGHNAALRILGRAELQHSGAPGPTVIQPADHDAFFERHDGLGGVTFDQRLSPSFHQHAAYAYSVSNQVSSDLVADSSSDFTYDSTNNVRRHYASYQADVRLPRALHADHLATFLADWNGERIHLIDRMPFDPTDPDANARHSRNNVGVSIQEQALWSRVFVTAGGRLEHNDNFGMAAVPQASMVVVAHDGNGALGETRLHASGGLGIKEPTVLQSFSTNAFFKGNPDLLPERSTSYEVGLDQRIANDHVKIEATLFDNRFRNQITLVNSVYQNINRTRGKGAELAMEAAPTPMLRLNGGYTLLDSSVVANATSSNLGVALLRRPRHSGFVGASLTKRRVSLSVTGLLVGHFADNDFGFPARTRNPGFNLWNARASVTVTKRLTIIGSLDNATNESYEEPLGYPGLGRAARIGLRVGY